MLVEGVYGSFKLNEESAKKLSDWIKENEIIEPVDTEDLHITTTYSKVDPEQEITPSEKKNIKLDHKDFSIATYGRALVIEVESKELQDIHKAAIDSGASYDYETYKPHITISYNAEANENIIPLLFPPNFDITLSHEEVEPLKEAFEMGSYYSFWGWIKPDGSLLLPDESMRTSKTIHNHVSLYNKYARKRNNFSYTAAFDEGYSRFAIDDDVLKVEIPTTVKSTIVEKGYKGIISFLTRNELDVVNIFGSPYSIDDLALTTFEIGKKNDVYQRYDTVPGKLITNLQAAIKKLEQEQSKTSVSKKKIKESDVPANSTANVATYAKPMTFKMFKRKMDLN
jgi:2'-5' RNA ligase